MGISLLVLESYSRDMSLVKLGGKRRTNMPCLSGQKQHTGVLTRDVVQDLLPLVGAW